MPTLAQLGINEPTFERLPSPAPLQHYLLESPWPIAAACFLIALIAFFLVSRRAQRRPVLLVAAISALLGAAILLLATLITTDREHAIRATRDLIAALAEAKPAPAQTLLHESVVLSVPGGLRERPTKADIIALINAAASRAGAYQAEGTSVTIDGYRVRSVLAQVTGDSATTQANVVATARESGIPTGSWWEITWQRDPATNAWRATRIELLWLAGFPRIGRA